MLFDTKNISIDELTGPLLKQKKVTLKVLRLDKIHPIVSGNKLFKLHYFIEEALLDPQKTIVTFGGAYSNHLAATAFACKTLHLKCRGIVRGEAAAKLSHTLKACMEMGMQLEFVSRERYAQISSQENIEPGSIIIPEGGYHTAGARGAALIIDLIKEKNVSHICTATGTATTLAGLLLKAAPSQIIISIPVLKGFTDIPERLQFLTGQNRYDNLIVVGEYHFGGYAKKTTGLIHFMNDLYHQYELPTDFVYTAKMMYGIFDQVKKGFFPEGSNIICIHTGGLQGNDSLPNDSLIFNSFNNTP